MIELTSNSHRRQPESRLGAIAAATESFTQVGLGPRWEIHGKPHVVAHGSVGPAKVITRVGMIFGTPEYMAPEQALGQNVNARADLYALGIVLFEMLCGKRPFSAGSPVGILGQQLQGPLPTFAKRAPGLRIPMAFEQLALRLLAPAAASRFQSAEQLALVIDALIEQRSAVAQRAANRLSRAELVPGARPALATNSKLEDIVSEEVLNGSTLPAPEYDIEKVLNGSTLPAPTFDVRATQPSHDTLGTTDAFIVQAARLPKKRILIWVIGGALTSFLVVAALRLVHTSKPEVA